MMSFLPFKIFIHVEGEKKCVYCYCCEEPLHTLIKRLREF
uniref:Uncharacterized protein n=1 Tax=Rhizophora mucronata TaxID=61149 RepID=A0A2P2QUW6_RHIMU